MEIETYGKPNSYMKYKPIKYLGGEIVKQTLKNSVGYIVGVLIAIVAIGLWRNDEINWQLMFSLMIGGFTGILIVSGIRMFMKKAKDKASE